MLFPANDLTNRFTSRLTHPPRILPPLRPPQGEKEIRASAPTCSSHRMSTDQLPAAISLLPGLPAPPAQPEMVALVPVGGAENVIALVDPVTMDRT